MGPIKQKGHAPLDFLPHDSASAHATTRAEVLPLRPLARYLAHRPPPPQCAESAPR